MPKLPPRRAKPPGDSEPGDELATWSHSRLLKMDARFRRRVELAFAKGRETRQSAAATIASASAARWT